MPKYRIISQPSNNITKREEIHLNDYEERKLRLSHGLYEFLNLDRLPTETHLVSGIMGSAFIKLWKLRKRKKDVFSIGMIKDM